jgi:hypothetical protein
LPISSIQAAHRHRVLDCGKRHRNPEAEGDAEIGLRNREETLEVGIGAGDDHGRHRQLFGQRVERQDQAERGDGQQGGNRQRFLAADAAAGDGTLRGALDVLVEVLVGIVVHGAACRAHQQRAEREDRDQHPVRLAAGSQPQRAQRRPQQQQGADRFV